jgi:predicted PurR-regulated permease PerM
MTAQSIENLADSLSRSTKFSEDTIQSGDNLLLTFTHIGKQVFPDATKSMLDMSQALGISTTKAAKDLGKALDDPLKAVKDLSKEHVNFTAAQQKSIQTMMAHNNIAGAQKVVLEAVKGAFGGAAQAAGQTFSGQLQILQNSMNNVKEKIGAALLPILGQLTGAITSVVLPAINKFSDWLSSPAFQNFASGAGKAISDAFTAIGNVLKTIDWKTIGDDFSYLGKQLGEILTGLKPPNNNLFKDIGGVLKTTVQDVGDFAKHLGDVVKWFKDGGAPATALKDALIGVGIAIGLMKIGEFVVDLQALIPAIWTWATAQGAVAIETLLTALPYIAIGALVVGIIALIVLAVQHWGDITKWLTSTWNSVSKWFQGFWADIVKIFGQVGKWFQDRFSEASKGVQSAFGNVGQWFGDRGKDIQNAFGGVGNWFHDRFSEASKGTQDAFGNIGQFLMGQWNDQIKGWQIIGQWFHDRFQEAWNSITGVFGNIGQFLMGLWDREVQGWTNIGIWFHDRFTEAWNAITGIFGGIGEWFHEKWQNIVDNFSNVFNGISSIASGVFNSVVGFFKNGFNNIIDLVNNVIRNIDNIKVAGFGVSIPLIPHLASGIENFVGGLALVGEKGPELVNLPRGASVLNAFGTENFFKSMALAKPAAMNYAMSGARYSAQQSAPIIVNVQSPDIYMDHKKVTDIVASRLADKIRMKGGVRSH